MDLREAAELVRQCVLNTTTGREVYPGQRCVQPGMVALSVARKKHEALRVVNLALATECAARGAVAQSRDDWRAKAEARGKVIEWMLKREWDALDIEALSELLGGRYEIVDVTEVRFRWKA